jgi:hypothetical protein
MAWHVHIWRHEPPILFFGKKVANIGTFDGEEELKCSITAGMLPLMPWTPKTDTS